MVAAPLRDDPLYRWAAMGRRDVLTLLRGLAVAACLAVAVASTWHTFRPTWRELRDARLTYASWSREMHDQSSARGAAMDPAVFDFFRHALRPGDRYYLAVDQRAYPQYP